MFDHNFGVLYIVPEKGQVCLVSPRLYVVSGSWAYDTRAINPSSGDGKVADTQRLDTDIAQMASTWPSVGLGQMPRPAVGLIFTHQKTEELSDGRESGCSDYVLISVGRGGLWSDLWRPVWSTHVETLRKG